MNFWLDHPSYAPVRDRLIKYLTSKNYRFRKLPPVVFLCGAFHSPARDTLRDYLFARKPDLSLFYADDVWAQIAARTELSALQMEEYLANLADMLVIIVESPGTFAELGAFSLVEKLRAKLLPILDSAYQHENSFIATGPVQWINQSSKFKPAIYVNLEQILTSVGELEERLNRIPKPRTTRIEGLATSPKHLLFFICDLLSVIEPANREIIEYYVMRIVPGVNVHEVSTLISLGLAMGRISEATLSINGHADVFYFRSSSDSLAKPFHHTRFLDLPTQRAEQTGVLLSIEEGRQALEGLSANL